MGEAKDRETYPLQRSKVTREGLTASIAGAPPHLRPLLLACRDHRCAWATVDQNAGPFEFPEYHPTICIVSDDPGEPNVSLGPTGFDAASLRRFIGRCISAMVVSCEALEEVYAGAAGIAAILRGDVVIIETRLPHEQAWLDFLTDARPDLPKVLATVTPMGRA